VEYPQSSIDQKTDKSSHKVISERQVISEAYADEFNEIPNNRREYIKLEAVEKSKKSKKVEELELDKNTENL
jgi:hypothetical protein